MIKQLQQASQVQNRIHESVRKSEFNNTLPVRLEILEKIHGVRYMAKVGNITLELKSLQELQIGGKYWAMMNQSSQGAVLLSKLVKQPELLEYKLAPLRLTPNDLEQFLLSKDADPFSSMKQFLGERLAMADSRWEFAFFTHMLLSLRQKILTIPLRYDEGEKEGFLQVRKRPKGKEEVEFYCVFANLGACSGILREIEEITQLHINVLYESTAHLLKDNLKELSFISEVSINIDENITPLYDFGNGKLLDIKG